MPEGIVLCDSNLIGGRDHAAYLLTQTAESWSRKLFLARNRSIDLLMRITSQAQITNAISASNVARAKNIALLGLAASNTQIDQIDHALKSKGAMREDDVLKMTKNKEKFLRRFHSIPKTIMASQLPSFLAEKSVLLIFDK